MQGLGQHDANVSPAADFETRLQQLRDAWHERREIARLVHDAGAGSQLELLQRIHTWAVDCATAITRIYGGALPVSVSPRPRGPGDASFIFSAAPGHRLVFSVAPRTGGGWRVTAHSLSGVAPGAAVGPSRRDGSWTRARVEDLVLAQVAAVERSRGGDHASAI